MPMEQETLGFLTIGYFIVIGVVITATLYLWLKNKQSQANSPYVWMMGHHVGLIIAFYYFLQLADVKIIHEGVLHPMASEEYSYYLSIIGICWAGAIGCLVVSLIRFSKLKSTSI